MNPGNAAILCLATTVGAGCTQLLTDAPTPVPRLEVRAAQEHWSVEVPENAFADPVLERRFSLVAPEVAERPPCCACGYVPPVPYVIQWQLAYIDADYRPINDLLSVSGNDSLDTTRFYRFQFVGDRRWKTYREY